MTVVTFTFSLWPISPLGRVSFLDSKPITLMAALVRAVLPTSQNPAVFDDADDSFEDSVEELESFASATSFVFQPGSAEIIIGASEAAVLLQAGPHSNH